MPEEKKETPEEMEKRLTRGIYLMGAVACAGVAFFSVFMYCARGTLDYVNSAMHRDVNNDGLNDIVLEHAGGRFSIFLQQEGGTYKRIEDVFELKKTNLEDEYKHKKKLQGGFYKVRMANLDREKETIEDRVKKQSRLGAK